MYPIYVELLPASPKCHSMSLLFQVTEVFVFSIGYYGEFEILGETLNIKTKM